MNNPVLAERAFAGQRASIARQAILVLVGIVALALGAKMQVYIWPSPVPITLGTLAVLGVGATYGVRLGLVTIIAYLLLGASGAPVFAGSTAGPSYMLGGTGGYLFGYAMAVGLLGVAARKALDRNTASFLPALLAANVLIYVPGLIWLRQFTESWEQTFAWGMTPFLIGDAIKLAIAALLVPAAWKAVNRFVPNQ